MESSRRDLFNDVTEHRSILKTDQNTYYPRLSSTPTTGMELPKTGVPYKHLFKSTKFGKGKHIFSC